jgi:hypothetical protein
MEDMERLAGPVHGSEELQDVLSTHQLNSGCYPVVLKRGTANLVLHMMRGRPLTAAGVSTPSELSVPLSCY